MIRDTGERTADACRSIVAAQLPPDRIVVLHERPFAAAVRRGLEIGADRRPAWLFTLDADVLLLPDAIARLRGLCDRVPGTAFHVKGMLLCKVFGGVQPRGFHAFRGSLLARALPLAGAPSVKPERAVIRAMEDAGFGRVFFPDVLGVHDYEQFYRHLYVKSLLRAHKTGRIDELLARLRALEDSDNDLRVALWGLEDGAGAGESFALQDWDDAHPAFESRIASDTIAEKAPFELAAASGYASRVLGAYRPAPDDLHHSGFAWCARTHRCVRSERATADSSPTAHALRTR